MTLFLPQGGQTMAGPAIDETDIDRPAYSQPDSDPDARTRLNAGSHLLTTCQMEVVGETDLAPCVRAWLNGEAVPI
jgi:hypothetical protein